MRYTAIPSGFTPWLPSMWPEPPASYIPQFAETLGRIIQETMLDEIGNVISDADKVNGGLTHRGHVVVLALLCAVDSMAAYAFSNITGRGSVGRRYRKFISIYFPADYQPFAAKIYNFYRNSSVHSWNLFQAGIWPGNEPIAPSGESLSFGLINFYDALTQAAASFLSDLPNNPALQVNSLRRYSQLKNSARP